jgi:long-chain fatty acid transport protein
MQLVIAPTVAYKLNNNHSIGISPLIAYQRFKAEGLQGFDNAFTTTSVGSVTNRGYDDAFGGGVRIGWMGKISDTVTLGAAYSTKIYMSEFDKYKGLFAEQGDFDIPENYNIGVAFKATPAVTVALDFQRINYSDVNSIGNPSANLFNITGSGMLGNDGGAGFGWKDVNVFKLGVAYQYDKNTTLRAGWNHGDNPIRASDVTFNILAPGVIKDNLTLGFSRVTETGGEWTVAYMHAFSNDVTGAHLLAGAPGGPPAGTTNKIKMHQDSIGIAYSWKM